MISDVDLHRKWRTMNMMIFFCFSFCFWFKICTFYLESLWNSWNCTPARISLEFHWVNGKTLICGHKMDIQQTHTNKHKHTNEIFNKIESWMNCARFLPFFSKENYKNCWQFIFFGNFKNSKKHTERLKIFWNNNTFHRRKSTSQINVVCSICLWNHHTHIHMYGCCCFCFLFINKNVNVWMSVCFWLVFSFHPAALRRKKDEK